MRSPKLPRPERTPGRRTVALVTPRVCWTCTRTIHAGERAVLTYRTTGVPEARHPECAGERAS